ncbi:hypothetical protein L249_1593, partial [Ophiocordyceps polyrhachis-furcata BCC 54312]
MRILFKLDTRSILCHKITCIKKDLSEIKGSMTKQAV